MKKFQMKNKFKILFLMAFVCAILFSSVCSLTLPNNENLRPSNTASAVEFSSNDVVSGLVQKSPTTSSSYSLSKIYPLLAENQTTSNLCWIYSSAKVLESSLMCQRGEYINISETGMAYVAYKNELRDSINSTGKFETFSTLATTHGLVYESDFSNDKYFDMTEDNSANYEYVLNKTSRNVIDSVDVVAVSGTEAYHNLSSISNKKELVKKYISTYGGLFAGLEDGVLYKDGPYIFDTNKTIEAEKTYLNGSHAVCIIGWNDDYGFLALNSWGTEISEFYIPYNYAYMYDTFYGFYAGSKTELVEEYNTSSSRFNELTHYTGSLNNVICYGEDITMKYSVDASVSFNSVYLSVFKGTEDVTKRFAVNYDDVNKVIRLDLTDSTNMFIGGDYLVKIYENGQLISVKSFFVFTGTEITYFTLEKDNLTKTQDSELLSSSFISSNNSVTYYVGSVDSYKLSFQLTEMNRYLNTSNSLSYTISVPNAYWLNGNTTTSSVVSEPFIKKDGILSDIQNRYEITIPQLYNYVGKLIKFKITIQSNIPEISCSRDYFINIFVSGTSTILTSNANAIEYVLDGGKNSENNLDRYPIYSSDTSATGFVLENPTKVGAEFVGWYLDPEFTTKVTKIDSALSGDIALYANWKKATEVVYFNSTFEIDGVTNYDGRSKNVSDDIIYGDTVKYKLTFVPTSDLEIFAYYSAEYFYYVNGRLVDEGAISRSSESSVYKTLGFPNLVVGTYNIKMVVSVVVSHSKSVSATMTGSFEVKQKTVDVTYSGLTPTYDGLEHKPTVTPESGDVYAEDVNAIVIEFSEEKQKSAGSYVYQNLTINNANYKLSATTGCTMVIARKKLSLAWDDLTSVYNGTAQGPTYTVEGVVAGDTVGVAFEALEMINAGSYEIDIDSSSLTNPNYELSDGSTCTFVIEKAELNIIVDSLVDRSETDPTYRKKITYTIDGKLYDKEEDLKISFTCEALTTSTSGTYPIAGTYDNANYRLIFSDATYKLTGFYYVYYELPNGDVHIEKVEEGNAPVGITDEIYKTSIFEKIEYSQPLESTGNDLHVVVTVKSNLWTVVIVSVIVMFILIYWVSSRKKHKNKVG